MLLSASLLLLLAGGAVVAGFVQGLSGFGFGLVAMSIWAWSVDPRVAAPCAVFGALTGQVIAAVRSRRSLDWPRLAPLLFGGLAGLPLGVWLLPRLDAALFQACIGAMLALWCPLMAFSGRIPQITVGGRGADALAGAAGGFSGAIGGFTGVIPTLWATLRGWPRDDMRRVVQNFNLAMLAVTMATHFATGIATLALWPAFAVIAPALFVPVLLGDRVYRRISAQAFRNVVLVLLTASGLALLAASLPQLLARSG